MKHESDDAKASVDELLGGPIRTAPEYRSNRNTGLYGPTPDDDQSGPISAASSRADRTSAAKAPPRRARLISVLAAGAVLLVLLVAALWWITGGRWQTVATPSMGQAAPVGTLVLTRPIRADQVRVGDIITFRSPAARGEIYTHRVVEIDPAGGLHTRGDINGASDPSVLQTKDLIGKVVARWWGIGWLLKALPLLVVGGLLLWYTTRRWVLPSRRLPIRMLGSSILVSIAALLLKPFVNFVVVMNMPDEGHCDLTVVSTGLLPIRINATGGAHLDLLDGQIAVIRASGDPGPHGYQITSGVHLSPVWWLVLILIWLAPLLLALLATPVEDSPRSSDDHDDQDAGGSVVPPAVSAGVDELPAGQHRAGHRRAGGPSDAITRAIRAQISLTLSAAGPSGHRAAKVRLRSRLSRRLLVGLAVVLTAAAGLVPSTESAFAAKVTNSVNTVGSNPYFTCRAAVTSTALPAFFAYPLSEQLLFLSAADASPNARNGNYVGNWTSTAAGRCLRDTTTTTVVSGGLTTAAQNYIYSPTMVANPNTFTIGIWFKTGANIGGRLIGFGNVQAGSSGTYDRHLYMTDGGQVVFGVYPNTVKVVTSPLTYSDGNWHQAVATLSATGGMQLYMDGALVASDGSTTTAQNYSGYWRVGWDNVAGWTNQPTNFNYRGTLAWPFVYNTVALSAAQVQQFYAAGS